MISTLKKKLSKKGFTLAELLIVVAIIAVLAAIAIPVFSSQLNKAKLAADHANIRSAYAQMRVYELEATSKAGTYYFQPDGALEGGNDTAAAAAKTTALKLQAAEKEVSSNWPCTLGIYKTTPDHKANMVIKVVITHTDAAGNEGTLTLE